MSVSTVEQCVELPGLQPVVLVAVFVVVELEEPSGLVVVVAAYLVD